ACVTRVMTDISSGMVASILPAYLVMAGVRAAVTVRLATGRHEGGPLMAAWMGGLIADRSGRRKLTAGLGYAVSAICRLGWLLLPGRSMNAVAGLVLSDRIGKAIRTAPRDAVISLSTEPGQLSTAFGVHRALDAAGRIGRRPVFVFGHAFLVLSYAAAFSRFPAWPWNALVCVASLGAFSAASDGVLPSLASGLLPAHTRAVGLAWVATAASAAR